MSRIEIANEMNLELSREALEELEGLGLNRAALGNESVPGLTPVRGRACVPKRAISAADVLNEAYDYPQPVAFSRGMRVELPGAVMLYLSGTASVDEAGVSVHPGDFPAQCLRTFRNLTQLLDAEQASWHDVVRTTCYLRDIERDYDVFNALRTTFMRGVGLDPLPASTGIQARLCRSDLLIEIEAIAIVPRT